MPYTDKRKNEIVEHDPRDPKDYGDDPIKSMVRHYDAQCVRKGEKSIFSLKAPTIPWFQQTYPGELP